MSMQSIKQMKPEVSPEGALVYSDWLQDHDHPAAEWQRWQLIGHLQKAAMKLWEAYGNAWKPSELRGLPMRLRTKRLTFNMGNQTFLVKSWFAAKEIIVTVYRLESDRFLPIGESAIRRTTIAKDGINLAFRKVVLRITEPKEECGQ